LRLEEAQGAGFAGMICTRKEKIRHA